MKLLKLNRRRALIVMSLFFFAGMTVAAEASLTYEFTGYGVSGDVGGIEFNSATMVVDIFAGANPILPDGTGGWFLTGLSADISIFGGDLGTVFIPNDPLFLNNPLTGTLNDPVDVYSTVDSIIGFGPSNPAGDFLDLFIPQVLGYDLSTLFGPAFAGVGFPGTDVINNFVAATSFGDLTIDDINHASFQAVPIPAPVLLLASGLLGLIGVRRRFKN